MARRRLGVLLTVAAMLTSLVATAQEVVHFPSLDTGRTMLDGYLFRAAGAGRHPAVVGLHGCSGMFTAAHAILPSEFAWAYLLNQRG